MKEAVLECVELDWGLKVYDPVRWRDDVVVRANGMRWFSRLRRAGGGGQSEFIVIFVEA